MLGALLPGQFFSRKACAITAFDAMRIENLITHHYHGSVISHQAVFDTQIDDGLFQVGIFTEVDGEGFDRFTPLVEPISIDEAFMDLTGIAPDLEQAVEHARRIKDRIKCELGLTASVGISASKFASVRSSIAAMCPSYAARPAYWT